MNGVDVSGSLMGTRRFRPSWLTIDDGALKRNITKLCSLAGDARYCAIVKANAYGHGALRVAEAAVECGAGMLGVATLEEAVELREGGIDAPILLLSEPSEEVLADPYSPLLSYGIETTVYSEVGIVALDGAACAHGTVAPVHLKVNTGMNRVGVQPEYVLALAKRIVVGEGLRLAGVCSHFAMADTPDDSFTLLQADRFDAALDLLASEGISTGVRHLANSAGLLSDPVRYRYDMVRCGIAQYGFSPSAALAGRLCLEPVLSLRSRLAFVRRLRAGEGISYGHQHVVDRSTWIGTVPLGYADGVLRSLSGRVNVLVRGVPRPIVGNITMDQFMVDLGEAGGDVGDEVVLLGRQGEVEITAQDWALALDTISYEILCGIGERVPRE